MGAQTLVKLVSTASKRYGSPAQPSRRPYGPHMLVISSREPFGPRMRAISSSNPFGPHVRAISSGDPFPLRWLACAGHSFLPQLPTRCVRYFYPSFSCAFLYRLSRARDCGPISLNSIRLPTESGRGILGKWPAVRASHFLASMCGPRAYFPQLHSFTDWVRAGHLGQVASCAGLPFLGQLCGPGISWPACAGLALHVRAWYSQLHSFTACDLAGLLWQSSGQLCGTRISWPACAGLLLSPPFLYRLSPGRATVGGKWPAVRAIQLSVFVVILSTCGSFVLTALFGVLSIVPARYRFAFIRWGTENWPRIG